MAFDDPPRAGAAARALQGLSILPVLAFESPQILASLETMPFDLVVLDLSIGGPRTEPMLRAVRARTEAPVVAVGGDDHPLDRILASGARAQLPADTPAFEVA